MAFAVTNNAAFADAVTAARNAHNSALPPLYNDEQEALPVEQHPDFKATNDAYRDFVLDQAAQSCRSEFGVEPSLEWAQATWDRAQKSYFAQFN